MKEAILLNLKLGTAEVYKDNLDDCITIDDIDAFIQEGCKLIVINRADRDEVLSLFNNKLALLDNVSQPIYGY